MQRLILTPRHKGAVLLLDFIVFLAASHITSRLRFGNWGFLLERSYGFWFISFSLLIALYIFGSYDLEISKFTALFRRQVMAIFVSMMMILSINYLLGKERSGVFGRGIFFSTMLVFGLISLLYRWALWWFIKNKVSDLKYLFIAHNDFVDLIKNELISKFPFSSELFVPLKINEGPVSNRGGSSNELLTNPLVHILRKNWTTIILALPSKYWNAQFSDLLMKTRFSGTTILNLDEFFENLQKKVPVDFLNQEWFVFEKGFSLINNPLGLRVKRLFDLVLALGLLMVTWPLIFLAALLIKIESPGKIFYKQVRTGLNDNDFIIYKLRSMTQNAESSGAQWATENDARITRVGKWLRLTRIDELPQLWNVIKGDMSFIGPRPERPEFNSDLEDKIPFYRLRHLVRPGITGWAQVMYPYGASIEDSKQKLQFDLYYIKNFSFLLDLKIIFKTIQVVLFGKGR